MNYIHDLKFNESYFGCKRKGNRGRGATCKTIVLGILEKDGKISIDIVKNVSAETLMQEKAKKVGEEALYILINGDAMIH